MFSGVFTHRVLPLVFNPVALLLQVVLLQLQVGFLRCIILQGNVNMIQNRASSNCYCCLASRSRLQCMCMCLLWFDRNGVLLEYTFLLPAVRLYSGQIMSMRLKEEIPKRFYCAAGQGRALVNLHAVECAYKGQNA